jgi:hypothetical protein
VATLKYLKDTNLFYVIGTIQMVMNIENDYLKIKSSTLNTQIFSNTILHYLLIIIKTVNINTLENLFVNSLFPLPPLKSKDAQFISALLQLPLVQISIQDCNPKKRFSH